ncbi:hypothetical protein SUGI_0071530 [Cryptomeria japonica]|nr:hypothetical protein SUGI_0071530 [Cryptomeria japonica]
MPQSRFDDPLSTIFFFRPSRQVFAPFAGRLREATAGKLAVECTGEGVLFVEADADVTLVEFGDIQPPIPGFDELLHNILSSQTVINFPLLLIQVCKSRVFNQIFVSVPW